MAVSAVCADQLVFSHYPSLTCLYVPLTQPSTPLTSYFQLSGADTPGRIPSFVSYTLSGHGTKSSGIFESSPPPRKAPLPAGSFPKPSLRFSSESGRSPCMYGVYSVQNWRCYPHKRAGRSRPFPFLLKPAGTIPRCPSRSWTSTVRVIKRAVRDS